MSSIKISEKHGVNPSVTVCFWCGGDVGVALLGRLRGDVEAPRKIVLDYEPCDKCKEQMGRGISLFECTHTPTIEGQPEWGQGGGYPTGRMVCVTEDAAQRWFADSPDFPRIMERRAVKLTREVFEAMNLYKDIEEEENNGGHS